MVRLPGSLYHHPNHLPPKDIPVQHGWGLIANGCGVLPAPELIIVYGEQTMQPRRIRNEETEAGAGSHEDQAPMLRGMWGEDRSGLVQGHHHIAMLGGAELVTRHRGH